MDKLSRRTWLKILALPLALRPALAAFGAAPVATDPDKAPAALGPFLDVLLPEDGTPSASQLGIDRMVWSVKEFSAGIARACDWLDAQARSRGAKDFASAGEATRIRVVEAAEQSPEISLPAVFLELMLEMSYQFYYSDPASWAGLNYPGPPQPRGFLDYTKPFEGPR